jgi:hypothetical protein
MVGLFRTSHQEISDCIFHKRDTDSGYTLRIHIKDIKIRKIKNGGPQKTNIENQKG